MSRVLPNDWQPTGVDELEQSAWDALRETDRNICVTAGAGAGKTEFLAQKAAYALQTGICPDPARILALSFKRDAARNLRARVTSRCSISDARRFDSMTFDGLTKSLLDRFGCTVPPPYTPSSGYQIIFPTRDDFAETLRNMPNVFTAKGLQDAVSRTRLPIVDSDLTDLQKCAVDAYWNTHMSSANPSLSFAMINRLVEFILRTNPQIRSALQLTYPFVFLDEFQDTTVAQFELLQTAFDDSETKFTAVGDDKQRIMGWADAMPNGFAQFQGAFEAREKSLVLNWRSHKSLVDIQRSIALRIDASAAVPEARGVQEIEGDVAAIWEFDRGDQECRALAEWVHDQVEREKIPSEQIAILVRMKANDVEDELESEFRHLGLKLRNVARMVGGVAIQDLLTEPLSEILLSLLRLGASDRDAMAWDAAFSSLTGIRGLSKQDERGQEELLNDIGQFSKQLREFCTETSPTDEAALQVIDQAISFVDEDTLRRAFPEYGRESDYNRIREAFMQLLLECSYGATTWSMVLDRFVGRGQVPLMTVHKSKGLEFHTIVFFGLDNRSWWSLERGDDEELKAFFVALSRARQRAFFTSCRERGRAITWIDELLIPAGVTRIAIADKIE